MWQQPDRIRVLEEALQGAWHQPWGHFAGMKYWRNYLMKRLNSYNTSNFRSMPLRALTGKMYSSTRQMTNITSQGNNRNMFAFLTVFTRSMCHQESRRMIQLIQSIFKVCSTGLGAQGYKHHHELWIQVNSCHLRNGSTGGCKCTIIQPSTLFSP